MSKMSAKSGKGPLLESALCRCCGTSKKCRVLNVEYDCFGRKEIYSDLFVDCFGLMLSHLDGAPEERAICATCVQRLHEACSFREQVLSCEQRLLKDNIQVHSTDKVAEDHKSEEVQVKEEPKVESVNCEPDLNEDGAEAGELYDDDSYAEESPKKVKRIKSKKKAAKSKKEKKSEVDIKMGEAKYVLAEVKRMSERLREMENVEMEEPTKPTKVQPKPKVFNEKERNARHNAVAIVENSYVCPFETFFSDYFCIYCRETFTDPEKLREHTLTHDPMTFKNIFQNKKILQIDIQRIDCRLCKFKIEDVDTFKQHISIVHKKVLFSNVTDNFLKFRLTAGVLACIECGKTFGFFHALRKHMAEHFGTCICDICGAHYFEERMLVIHQKTHFKSDENYPCKECGKTFKSKHSRYFHETKMHAKEPAYECSKCDQMFFSYMTRYRHMREAHGYNRSFQCEHCERTYDSRKSLREHNRRNHLKILKHQCDLCDKRFYLPSRLKEHLATHTGERNFRCEFCGKSYPRLRGLQVHMQSHSVDKKYSCVLCNASFTQNVNLRNHMKRQHQSLDGEEGYHE